MKPGAIIPGSLKKTPLGHLFAVLGVITFATSAAAKAEDVYFPLGPGMEWIMDLKVVSTNGVTSNGVFHRKIGEPVEFNGKSYFRSHTWLEEDKPFHMDYTKLVRRDTNGFYSLDERDPDRIEKQGGRLPMEAGMKWDNHVEGGIVRTEVLAKEDANFGTNIYKNCFHVRITADGSPYQEEFIEAPNVGSLKSEIHRPDGATWTLTLREFKNPSTK